VDIYNTKLSDQPQDEWINSILWRLGVATGRITVGQGTIKIDADEILELAEDIIWRYSTLVQ
jgi:hypothetical protein